MKVTSTTIPSSSAHAVRSKVVGSSRVALLGLAAVCVAVAIAIGSSSGAPDEGASGALTRDALRSSGEVDAGKLPEEAARGAVLDRSEEARASANEAKAPAPPAATPVTAAPFAAGNPRFGGIPEGAARAIVESVQEHHELAQLLRKDPKAPASTVQCVDFLFAVWPEIDSLVECGLVEVTATPLEPRLAGTQRGVTYTIDRDGKRLAAAIWHPQWSCSLRFRGGGSQQEAFERVFRAAEAVDSEAGR